MEMEKQHAARLGMSRRGFLQALAAGGTVAALSACTEFDAAMLSAPAAMDAALPYFKDSAPFRVHPGAGLEARLEAMQGVVTPTRLFFVRNNSASPDLEARDWRLLVEGDGISTPLELSYPDIRGMPGRTLVSYLECAGNHRAMFDLVQGRPAQGTQWMTGAVGNAEWTGVALRDVLMRAGIREDAASVLLIGLDVDAPEEGFRRVLPVAKAMHPDTLLAYAMNADVLSPDHGFPLRAVVPGWVGSSSIKWLGRIQVSTEPLWTRNNSTSYVLIGDDFPTEGDRLGPAVTTQTIKSALALSWPAELSAGPHRIHGYAQSPYGPIEKVEWSMDGGATWREAAAVEPQFQYSWARFRIDLELRTGLHTIMTRATDAAGNTQPDSIPFNAKGYLFNQPVPHPLRVG